MAEGTDAPYRPNVWTGKPAPLPDEMLGSQQTRMLPGGEIVRVGTRVKLRPNDPAPPSEPVADKRPAVILAQAGFESAEDWGNSILSKKNGEPPKQVRFGDEGDIA
jgi:hypothetical protein